MYCEHVLVFVQDDPFLGHVHDHVHDHAHEPCLYYSCYSPLLLFEHYYPLQNLLVEPLHDLLVVLQVDL